MKKKQNMNWLKILLIIFIILIIAAIIGFCIITKQCSCDDGESFKNVMTKIKENKTVRDPEIFARKRGSGIILVAGGPVYGKLALENVKSIREKGSVLPIEIFYLGKDELNNEFMKELRDMKDVNLVDIYDYYDLSNLRFPNEGLGCFLTPYSTKRGYGFVTKSLALKYSKFRHIILLDADNICLKNPDNLLKSKYYMDYGAIFWRDMHEDFSEGIGINVGIIDAMKLKTVGLLLKDISKPSNENALRKINWSPNMPQICSAQLVIDSVRHSLGVDYIANINENCDVVYANFWGDKDTYAFGLKLADEEYYVVPQKPIFLGKNIDNKFYGHSFIQVDPDDNSFMFRHRNSDKNKNDKYDNVPDTIKYPKNHEVPKINNLGIMGYDYGEASKGGYQLLKNFNSKFELPITKIFKKIG